jgi:hypothetical protein
MSDADSVLVRLVRRFARGQKETSMTPFRKFICAAALAVATFSLAPALASAQESHGQFTLPHSVLWEKATVPAGQYAFNFKNDGATGVLTLTKLDSPHAGFLFMVNDTEESQLSDISKLTLQNFSAGSYVSAMTLGKDGITLRFTPPSKTEEKVVASNGSLASGR